MIQNAQIDNIENGYQIPENSIIKLFGNWDEIIKNYNNIYLIGFFN